MTAPGDSAGTASAPGSPRSSVIIFVISVIERPLKSTGRPRKERKEDTVDSSEPVSMLEESKVEGFVSISVISVLIRASAVLNLSLYLATA